MEDTERFHKHMIELAGNAALLRAYGQLRLPGISLRVLVADDTLGDRLRRDHLEIGSTMRRRDWPALPALLIEHSERGRAAHRRAIERAGGRV